jgi:sphingolipid delta-4 desaturase
VAAERLELARSLDYSRPRVPHAYIHTTKAQPHLSRSREMLQAHPELRELTGPETSTALWTGALVVLQCGLAIALRHSPWWLWLPCAYVVGATIDHALWAVIHECCHNLVFRSRLANRAVAIAANIPIVVPGAMSFFKYHLLHHVHLGEMDLDTGIPGPTEARLVGRSSLLKSLWLAGYIFISGIVRPRRLKIDLLDGWTIANLVFQAGAMAALVSVAGWQPLVYLSVSTVFAIGLHPLGGRWIQEHFALAPHQETYSYYGPLNRLAFNIGYHNEHHDLVTVPWSRLPRVRHVAPEFYQGLTSYASWTGILVHFLRNRDISLFSYIVRPDIRQRPSDTVPAAAVDQPPVLTIR